MTPVFADSSYYIGLVVRPDQAHARAIAATDHLRSGIVTTVWVLTEVANALSATRFRGKFVALWDDLQRAEATRVVEPDPQIFRQGIELYRNRLDKDWSLTDCISFVVMERERITDALTSDHHFEQAGFKALLSP
jgi:predicted nucleic acid-binding protein